MSMSELALINAVRGFCDLDLSCGLGEEGRNPRRFCRRYEWGRLEIRLDSEKRSFDALLFSENERIARVSIEGVTDVAFLHEPVRVISVERVRSKRGPNKKRRSVCVLTVKEHSGVASLGVEFFEAS